MCGKIPWKVGQSVAEIANLAGGRISESDRGTELSVIPWGPGIPQDAEVLVTSEFWDDWCTFHMFIQFFWFQMETTSLRATIFFVFRCRKSWLFDCF